MARMTKAQAERNEKLIKMIAENLNPTEKSPEVLQVEKWIEKTDKPVNSTYSASVKANILSSVDNLKQYINQCVIVERDIYAVKERLIELTQTRKKFVNKRTVSRRDIRESLHFNLDRAYSRRIDDIVDWKKEQEASFPPRPIPPEEPKILKPAFMGEVKEPSSPPVEPVYETPGFFNKKKVAERNAVLKRRYEADLDYYNKQKHQYAEYCAYIEQEKEYERVFQQYDEELEQFRVVEKEWKQDIKKRKAVIDEKVKADRAIAKANQDAMVAELKEFVPRTSEDLSIEAVETEIAQAKSSMKKLLNGRASLYSVNVIYPKYRDLVSLSSFYEYLDSGRCATLEGPDGAYNIYEAEIRADTVITQLSTVIVSLNQIQKNQYMIVSQLETVNSQLFELNNKMDDALVKLDSMDTKLGYSLDIMEDQTQELRSISSDTSNLVRTTGEIKDYSRISAENSSVIAYNTAATAFYSKRNAELTDALGFMVALK